MTVSPRLLLFLISSHPCLSHSVPHSGPLFLLLQDYHANFTSWMWWPIPLRLVSVTLGNQESQESKVLFSYIVKSRVYFALCDPFLEKKKEKEGRRESGWGKDKKKRKRQRRERREGKGRAFVTCLPGRKDCSLEIPILWLPSR